MVIIFPAIAISITPVIIIIIIANLIIVIIIEPDNW